MLAPFYDFTAKSTIVAMHDMGNNCRIEIWAVPSWPCYPQDGAKKVMNFNLEMRLIDAQGNTYTITERKE